MGKHKFVKSAAAVALVASAVTAVAPGASAASYKVNSKDQLVSSTTGKLVKGWKVFGGKLYKNGKLAPAKKYKIIGTGAAQRLYYGPTLKKGYKTANSKTLLFKDGKLADGWKQAGKNERLYKNGKLDKGYTVYNDVEGEKFLYQNGKLKKGLKTATRGGETNLFQDGLLAKGLVEFGGKTYNNGKLANGTIDGKEYKDGVVVVAEANYTAASINATTVEVTFAKAVDTADIKAENFTIEGLTVSNAVAKQSDAKTVILTTSAQEAGKEYAVSYKGAEAAKFTAINNTVPTAIAQASIKPYQTSQQAKIGEQVTVKAQVTVAEGQSKAGIPVTFVIDNTNDTASGSITNQGKDQTVEVKTDENGVATYTYTQYAASEDHVTAYPTGAPTQRTSTVVYWGVQQPLTVSEVTTGATLANNGKKVYKVSAPAYKGKDATVNVTFAENYEVTPDQVNYKATIDGVTPYQTQVAGKAADSKAVKVQLDANGEATFTVTGADTSVTPVVFFDTVNADVNGKNRLNATELQATATTVKFENIKTVGLTHTAVGSQKAAAATSDADFTTKKVEANQGGRAFTATLTDNEGKTAPAGTPVYLTFADEDEKAASLKGKLHVYDAEGKEVEAKDGVYTLATNSKGEVNYYVASEVTNNYATPVLYLENGSKAGLDTADTQAKAEITYFGDATVTKAEIKADGKTVTPNVTVNNKKSTKVTYQTVDQNGFAYTPGKEVKVTFNVDTTFGNLKVLDKDGKELTTVTATGNTNNTTFEVATNAAGYAEFTLETDRDTTVNLSASGSQTIIDNVAGKIIFTNTASTGNTLPQDKVITAEVTAFDTDANTITLKGYETSNFNNKKFTNAQAQTIDQATFEKLVGDAIAAGNKVEVTYDYNDGKPVYGIVSLGEEVPTQSALETAQKALETAITTAKSAEAASTPQKAYLDEAVKTAEKALAEAKTAAEVKEATKNLEAAQKEATKVYTLTELNELLAETATVDTSNVELLSAITVSIEKANLPAYLQSEDDTVYSLEVEGKDPVALELNEYAETAQLYAAVDSDNYTAEELATAKLIIK